LKEGAEKIHMPLDLFFKGIKINMLLLIILCLIPKLRSVSGDCDFGNLTEKNFDWYKVGINV
jgi:hypothetical protein